MNASPDLTVFRFCDLPPELILKIVTHAQRDWLVHIFSPKDPPLGTRRHFVSYQRFPSRRLSCSRNISRESVPGCLFFSNLAVAPSPAHSVSQTARGLRRLLLSGNRWLWQSDNTFYKAIAERSGFTVSVGTPNILGEQITVEYQSRILVAQNVCSCLIICFKAFYDSLEMIKLALPWGHPANPTTSIEDYMMRGDRLHSPLQHFDLELYHSSLTPLRPVIQGVLSPVLLTCRCINASFFFYSPIMTHLFIQYPVDREPFFNTTFTDALFACAASLESLTVDACAGQFQWFDEVTLPRLRFFRLVAPYHCANRLLQRLTLPADVECQLESVINWRRMHAHDTGDEAMLESEVIDDSRRLWRYAAAVAFPNMTSTIFQIPPSVDTAPEDIWPTLSTVALNIRLDPSTNSTERACARFPEYVGLAFAHSVAEMTGFLLGRGHAWYHLDRPGEAVSARRSIAVRDGDSGRQARDLFHSARLVKPLYDVVRHVVRTVITGRPGTPYTGLPSARHLVIHPESFMPAFSLGWAHILDDFRDLEVLVVLCPGVPQGAVFADNMEGCLDVAHLEALGLYLNGMDDGGYPCPSLERVELPSYTAAFGGGRTSRNDVEAMMNSVLRTEALGGRIAVACT